MSTPDLLQDLMLDEGVREQAYADAGGVWTIGVGHTGPEVHRGLAWSRDACLQALDHDVARVEHGLDRRLAWWRTLSAERQDVLANMAFNLGVDGLLAFRRTLAAVQAGDYAQAASHMLTSEPWRSQVGRRAKRLADQMRSGQRAHPPAGGRA